MKRFILICVSLFILINALPAQQREMQLSGGFEFGMILLKIDNSFGFSIANGFLYDYYLATEKTESVYFGPGLTFSVRHFSDLTSNLGFFLVTG